MRELLISDKTERQRNGSFTEEAFGCLFVYLYLILGGSAHRFFHITSESEILHSHFFCDTMTRSFLSVIKNWIKHQINIIQLCVTEKGSKTGDRMTDERKDRTEAMEQLPPEELAKEIEKNKRKVARNIVFIMAAMVALSRSASLVRQ